MINSYALPILKFSRHCLINSNISPVRKIINIYISNTLDLWWGDLNADVYKNTIFGTCSCKNSKFLASIIDDSVITCDEIVKETKSVVTNFNKKYSM